MMSYRTPLALALALLAAGAHAQPLPTEWWVNCNGFTGPLLLEVDARTDRVAGTLMGTPVEGYLVGRRLVLHRFPEARGQVWDAWVLDPAWNAEGRPAYHADRTLAGTCSMLRGGVQELFPFFGIEAGATGGIPVATADPDPPGGLVTSVAGSLRGLRWELPCATSGGVCQAEEPRPTHSTRLGGDPGQLYDVTLRFRGVVEYHSYAGGRQDGLWYVGGQSAQGSYNIYQLDVSDPQQTFFLNADRASIGRTWAIDYTRTVQMRGGATVTLSADAQDGALITNHDDKNQPIVVPGVPPAPEPYDGQFIQMDVVSVEPARR